MTKRYVEAREIAGQLKDLVEGVGDIGGTADLHFDLLQVTWGGGVTNV